MPSEFRTQAVAELRVEDQDATPRATLARSPRPVYHKRALTRKA